MSEEGNPTETSGPTIDPVEVAVLLGCLLFFVAIAWKYVL